MARYQSFETNQKKTEMIWHFEIWFLPCNICQIKVVFGPGYCSP